MGFREAYGQMIEDALNMAVDKYLSADMLKAMLHAKVDELIDGNLEELKRKLKADIIDQIDGEDDIK